MQEGNVTECLRKQYRTTEESTRRN